MLKPFLRWAGGKSWLINHIDRFLPEKINNYFEPFLGGGAIFFYLKSKNLIEGSCYLSDSNEELINTYNVLKNYSNKLFTLLKSHKNSESEYYSIRKAKLSDPIERAARFMYLNKTSFNGIYRVNRNGEYNVPFGHRKIEKLYDFENLHQISECLKDCFFYVEDFKKVANKVKADDLIFIDPPYTVAHENNGFIHYNQSLFSWDNQIELSNILEEIKKIKANFIMTNASHSSIEELYKNAGEKSTLIRASTIGGIGANRTKYKELVYTNFKD